MQKNINGATFRKMILAGGKILEDNRNYVDSLNVFPVPDGDTGTNMSLTLNSACKEVSACPNNNLDSLCEAVQKGALRGARGNSGVILSQILKGMCTVLSTEKEINVKNFAKAINSGAEVAYNAVTKPKEGTILTVIRMMSEAATKLSKKNLSFEDFFKGVLAEGEQALQMTPELLPVLKKAGVVDSGGQGLMLIFNGFYKLVIGDESVDIKLEENPTPVIKSNAEINLMDLEDIEFAYCTEFMVIQMHKKTTLSDIDRLREKLMQIGDSVICIGDLSLVKVHVHTNEPNKALAYGLELGELFNLKIENMLEENRELKKQKMLEEMKEYGLISVCAGTGLVSIFKDVGVDYVLEGGQTMNPSADDILKAVDSVNAKNIFILPNNKNIILACEQAKQLTNKNLIVIPSKNIPEGMSACLAFNPEAGIEDNEETMTDSLQAVYSASVTYAVRNTNVDGLQLSKGDIIGLTDSSILAKGSSVDETVVSLLDKIVTEDIINISLFYGNDLTEEEAVKLQEKLQEIYPDKEISCLFGGQPVYYYLISLE
ncbi:MAG: DAK2 domain-containing protein [Clostridiales bacterium]|nr:DAK2 domain-containing protein [Clostridiales bacterium]